MARLPIPGSDQGDWGQILNEYLSVTHNADGTLKDAGIVAGKASIASLALVATSGNYLHLTNKPVIPAQLNLTAGANVSLSGAYPDITISATSDGVNTPTNLSTSRSATDVAVMSSTGTTATVSAADTTNAGVMTAADRVKLTSIATAATANSSDANLRDRATHTGSQTISTVTGLQASLDSKITGQNGVASLWTGTQSQYDAITTPNPTTVYIVYEA